MVLLFPEKQLPYNSLTIVRHNGQKHLLLYVSFILQIQDIMVN